MFLQQRDFFHFVFVSSMKRAVLLSFLWVNGQVLCVELQISLPKLKVPNSFIFLFSGVIKI